MRNSLAGLVLCLAAASAGAGELYKDCTVFAVSDGDSIRVRCEGRKSAMSVRLAGIDAPELTHKALHITQQPGGDESRAALITLCLGKPAVVSVSKLDRYKRHLAVVHCAGVNVNEEQVRKGQAWAYLAPKRSAYPKLQAEAQAAHRGLWAHPGATAPSIWRKGAPD